MCFFKSKKKMNKEKNNSNSNSNNNNINNSNNNYKKDYSGEILYEASNGNKYTRGELLNNKELFELLKAYNIFGKDKNMTTEEASKKIQELMEELSNKNFLCTNYMDFRMTENNLNNIDKYDIKKCLAEITFLQRSDYWHGGLLEDYAEAYKNGTIDKLINQALKQYSYKDKEELKEVLYKTINGKQYTEEELLNDENLFKIFKEYNIFDRVRYKMTKEEASEKVKEFLSVFMNNYGCLNYSDFITPVDRDNINELNVMQILANITFLSRGIRGMYEENEVEYYGGAYESGFVDALINGLWEKKNLFEIKKYYLTPENWAKSTIEAYSFHGPIKKEYLEKIEKCKTWEDVWKLEQTVIPHLPR